MPELGNEPSCIILPVNNPTQPHDSFSSSATFDIDHRLGPLCRFSEQLPGNSLKGVLKPLSSGELKLLFVRANVR